MRREQQATFELWQDGIVVAIAWSADVDGARREIWHYAGQYAYDGPCEVRSPSGHDPRPDFMRPSEPSP